MLNGATQLCMMKADVLDAFDEVQVCTHYEVDGETSEHLPYLLEEALVKPVFESRPGWPGAGQSGEGTAVARLLARLRQGNRVVDQDPRQHRQHGP